MHIIYEVQCDEQHTDAIERAIQLSKSTYCGVYAMLAKASTITHEVRIAA